MKAKSFEKLDIDNLIKEVELIIKSHQDVVFEALFCLISELLIWEIILESTNNKPNKDIACKRETLKNMLQENPSLREYAEKIFQDKDFYNAVLHTASIKTKLTRNVFPRSIPYTFEQILDNDYYSSNREKDISNPAQEIQAQSTNGNAL